MEMVESYRTTIVPLASILVPNQFEAELITEMKINNIAEGFQACVKLQDMGPSTVVRI
jgi:pyridoxine kinase